MSLILPSIGAFGHTASGPSGPDDDFGNGSIEAFWTQQLPPTNNSDLSFSESGGAVTLTIGNTYTHDPYNTAVPATAVLVQDIAIGTGDFTIDTQWDSTPSAGSQGHGIYLEDGDGDWQRHDVSHNGTNLIGFSACWNGSSMDIKLATISVSHSAYVRVARSSGTTRVYVSSNGSSWSEVRTGFADTRSWTKAGIFGMRSGGAGAYGAACTNFTYT